MQLFLIHTTIRIGDQIKRLSEIFRTENINATSVSDDEIEINRNKNNAEFYQRSYEVLVHLIKLLREEMVGKPCKREEQHGYKLYLTIHSSEVKEKTGEELIVPASDEDVENNGRVKVS